MAKLAADRYTTAHDLADDLQHWSGTPSPSSEVGRIANPSYELSATDDDPRTRDPVVRIVPKGLRAFDAHDADFFLKLLPGPRDRDGLPDSLRFWKTRIEETDADNTFAVGLIYGPSGCGKSSLVKAGLLPRLSDDVSAVYIEATAGETETRLSSGLRKHYPTLPAGLRLKEMLAALRAVKVFRPARKCCSFSISSSNGCTPGRKNNIPSWCRRSGSATAPRAVPGAGARRLLAGSQPFSPRS